MDAESIRRVSDAISGFRKHKSTGVGDTCRKVRKRRVVPGLERRLRATRGRHAEPPTLKGTRPGRRYWTTTTSRGTSDRTGSHSTPRR